jgi:hypothetical protein
MVIVDEITISKADEVILTIVRAVLIPQTREKVAVDAVQVDPLCNVTSAGKVTTRDPPVLGI